MSLNVKDVDLCDHETGMSNSNSMSVNSFASRMKPVHHDSRDCLHKKQDGDFFTPVKSDLAADWSELTHHGRVTIRLLIIIKKRKILSRICLAITN